MLRILVTLILVFSFQAFSKEKKLTPQNAWRNQTSAFKDKMKTFEGQEEGIRRKYRKTNKDTSSVNYQKKKDLESKQSNEIAEMKKN